MFGKFEMIVSLYNETNRERRKELLYCLKRNIKHPLIRKIHIFYDESRDKGKVEILDELATSARYIVRKINGRPTYEQLFDYANQHIRNKKVIIANSDIYFNRTFRSLRSKLLKNKFIVLTRCNVTGNFELEYLVHNGLPNFFSADAWIFKTPVDLNFYCNYQLGTMFCDSFLNTQLFKSGMQVYNPCYDVQACHLQKEASLSQNLRNEESRTTMNGILLKETKRNNGGEPLSGVIWCRLHDIKKEFNTQFYKRSKAIIIESFHLKNNELAEMLDLLKGVPERFDKNIWFFEKEYSRKRSKLLLDFGDPDFNFTYKFKPVPPRTITPHQIDDISALLSRSCDIYIREELLELFKESIIPG